MKEKFSLKDHLFNPEKVAFLAESLLTKNHFFRSGMTTRQLYKGPHRIEIQINGAVLEAFEFDLV